MSRKIDFMNSTVIKVFFLLIFISTAFATVELIRPGLIASPDGENIRLEWNTGVEENLVSFIVERKTPESSWIEIETIQPKGNNSNYYFIDKSAYKANDLIFLYRIKIHTNESIPYHYSNEVTVYSKPNDVKRTWGSIKAMFR